MELGRNSTTINSHEADALVPTLPSILPSRDTLRPVPDGVRSNSDDSMVLRPSCSQLPSKRSKPQLVTARLQNTVTAGIFEAS